MKRLPAHRFALSRRSIQIALGCLWILDGLLKFQPAVWHAGFVKTVVAPNADGQPGPLSWVVNHTSHLLVHGQGIWVTIFGLIEIAIGAGLLWRRSTKVALTV